jgi:hypothetical protein
LTSELQVLWQQSPRTGSNLHFRLEDLDPGAATRHFTETSFSQTTPKIKVTDKLGHEPECREGNGVFETGWLPFFGKDA